MINKGMQPGELEGTSGSWANYSWVHFCILEVTTDDVTVYIDTVPILSLCHACGNNASTCLAMFMVHFIIWCMYQFVDNTWSSACKPNSQVNLEALAAAEPIIHKCIFYFLELATDSVTVYIDTVPILSLCRACDIPSVQLERHNLPFHLM